jgi:hypothetical protein
MVSDDLVAEDVASWSKSAGYSRCPGAVVGNKIGCSPGLGGEVNAGFVNFDELEGCFINLVPYQRHPNR